jgi:alcohol dehydrogenase
MPKVDLPAESIEDSPIAPALPPADAIPAARRHRPHGWLRHYAGFLTPNATAAMPVLLERDRERLRRTRPRMRALQAAPGARLRWHDVPVPAPPGPDGAIVHPIACSTCDLDCGIALGATQFALPLHLGHECVA